jgi:hypothetical protein
MVLAGSALFFGALIYKAIWLIRKVNQDPEGSPGTNAEAPSKEAPSKKGED